MKKNTLTVCVLKCFIYSAPVYSTVLPVVKIWTKLLASHLSAYTVSNSWEQCSVLGAASRQRVGRSGSQIPGQTNVFSRKTSRYSLGLTRGTVALSRK